jgi:hypothetical protein
MMLQGTISTFKQAYADRIDPSCDKDHNLQK